MHRQWTDGLTEGWTDGRRDGWLDGGRDGRTDRSWAIDGSSRAFDQALENHCVCQDASSSCPVVGNVAGGSWPQRPSQRFSEPTGCFDFFPFFPFSEWVLGGLRLPLWSIFAPEMRGSSSLSPNGSPGRHEKPDAAKQLGWSFDDINLTPKHTFKRS